MPCLWAFSLSLSLCVYVSVLRAIFLFVCMCVCMCLLFETPSLCALTHPPAVENECLPHNLHGCGLPHEPPADLCVAHGDYVLSSPGGGFSFLVPGTWVNVCPAARSHPEALSLFLALPQPNFFAEFLFQAVEIPPRALPSNDLKVCALENGMRAAWGACRKKNSV